MAVPITRASVLSATRITLATAARRGLSTRYHTNTVGRWAASMRGPSAMAGWQSRRALSLASLFTRKSNKPTSTPEPKPALSQDELFYPLRLSPMPDLKSRGDAIAEHGTCPACLADAGVSELANVETLPATKKPAYTCPDCGFPTHCSREHWERDREAHARVCSTLRQVNMDEHDLRSGRQFVEFEYPGPQGFEEAVNLTNWDTFFYTRSFPSLNTKRLLRHVSKPLTYPITIASILHDTSPHTASSGLTLEGVKSLTALRYTLAQENSAQQSPGSSIAVKYPTPVRIIIPGARAESQLPIEAWMQLLYLFPNSTFQLHFIGPEVKPPPSLLAENQPSEGKEDAPVEDTAGNLYHRPISISPIANLQMFWHNSEYDMRTHQSLAPFDPYRDVFFYFCPGFGHPRQRAGWHAAVRMAIRTQCAMFATGFDAADIQQDCGALAEDHSEEMDWLMSPTINEFRSLKPDVFPGDVQHHIYANWSVYGVRGKRYEVRSSEEDAE